MHHGNVIPVLDFILKSIYSQYSKQNCVLQEPAFEELILLYTEERGEEAAEDRAEAPSLQLKIYEKIPIPDLPVNILRCNAYG